MYSVTSIRCKWDINVLLLVVNLFVYEDKEWSNSDVIYLFVYEDKE
jgi:hypothetical protein